MVDDDEPLVGVKDGFEEEADEHDESDEKFEEGVDLGEKEADPYSKEGREKLEDDDEAKPGELGYAKGAARGKGHGQTKSASKTSLTKKKR